jgi:hypothetical protein
MPAPGLFRDGHIIAPMPKPYVMQQSRAIPVDVDEAFARTLAMSLPAIFKRRYGPIAPVKAVSGQTGDWDAVGQTRTVSQVGGGSTREELTTLDRPHAFGYTLADIKGPLAQLVDHVVGEWRFAPAGTGTKVTWSWTVYPKSAPAALAMPAFARMWRGFARQSLEQLSDELVS